MPCGQRASSIYFIGMMVVAMYLALIISATHCGLVGKLYAFPSVLKVLLLEVFGGLNLATRQLMVRNRVFFVLLLNDTSRALHFELIY